MTTKTLLTCIAGALLLASCATRESMPFSTAKDCFYPACVIDVAVVEEGGVRKLKLTGDGNVRMGTRHRLTAIVWNLQTPGYEFRGFGVRPHAGATAMSKATSVGQWDSQMINHGWWYNSVSLTNLNTEPVVLAYDITVYPDRTTGGPPVTATAGIMNAPGPHSQLQQ
jgi:hypothetical protein